jgi:GNAT superfamily N-acetyltransferase
LFQDNELIGISSGWTTVRIYCGKQIELDNVIIDSTIQSKGYGKYFMEAISKWALKNNYKSIGLNTYVQNSRSHKFYFNKGFKILGFHFEKKIS